VVLTVPGTDLFFASLGGFLLGGEIDEEG
jgi:hypothetical protein